uniref:transmembrane protein 269 isoform X3 n=1 Tax=Doryrhamphus excisus TaxID=161450 RepID=UPI0025AE4236|nr:transmembrane protein 269 isoform X3 [Doryrhamphus excisus]
MVDPGLWNATSFIPAVLPDPTLPHVLNAHSPPLRDKETQQWRMLFVEWPLTLKFPLVSCAKLDDFADFTTFGIATSLLLRTPDLLDNILCMCYALSVLVRLCFFSSGIPFMYRGLPCIYSSAILASASLLSGGNTAVLRVIAVAMILFMIRQNFYPHDRVLESQAWKKVVYVGGVLMLFCSSFAPACVYYLLWSVSYILFPTSLWSSKV